ncbi:hypothetical protein MKK84_16335 [Methylobacterium sp. E-065]|uniref:hypothetical protein n=1 Tax=Methylobacterium sp. E-065 TaxID=2836583 RepID=UPI001FB9D7BF|nr:hypothetical protein [Methylobacterium sp. E-065]MCJ2018991.1 hypothetical protein [Methylobacterium sp. E-065]
MKRRSARPFMVEVKNARTPRTALRDVEPQARPDKVLWPELVQAAEPKPRPVLPALDAAPAPGLKEPDAPARRVLPSLVPMFQNTDEPEPEPEPAIEPRRTRTRREKAPAVTPAVRTSTPVETLPEIRAAAIQPEAGPSKPLAADPAGPKRGTPPRPAAWRRTKELRLGERWKRRLPPYLR